VSRLALHGGPRAVELPEPHFVWPPVTPELRRRVDRQLDESISIYNRSGAIARLEDGLQRYHGVKRALLTSSGTAALHSMYVAAQLGPGDEVICPAYTFYATVTPLFQTGAWPVLADCGPDGNIDPEDVRRRITPRTKAIVMTHMWGVPCDVDALRSVAREHGLMLLEDGSHACGARFRGEPVGCVGTAGAFSMQAQKALPAGEGGFVLTGDDELFYRALLFGHYNRRCKDEIPADHELARFSVTGMGLKLRIHPLACAIASYQLEELDRVLAGRKRMAAAWRRGLEGLPGLRMPDLPSHVESSWYAFIVSYDPAQVGGLPVAKLHAALLAEGCAEVDRPASTCPLSHHPLFQSPGTLFPAYRDRRGYQPGDFPAANAFHASSLKLPVWHDERDLPLLEQYVAAFRKVLEHHRELVSP
jgi:perosamine synthetase